LRVCIAAEPESLLNFLLTPDQRGEASQSVFAYVR
jgi:hypothetical protein